MTSTLPTRTVTTRSDGWIDAGPLDLTGRDVRVRAELIDAVRFLHRRGALQNPDSANASALLPERPGHVLISAKGLPHDVDESRWGIVTIAGELVAGNLGPGVQSVLRMHTLAYARPEVGAVIHTHSWHTTAFALAHRPIPPNYEPLVNRGQTVPIPVAPYRKRNNGELGESISELLEQHPLARAVLLANHGLLAFDAAPRKTAELVATIEEAAALEVYATGLGGSQPIAR